jgi:hypothetical protein
VTSTPARQPAPGPRPRSRWLLPDDGIIDPIAVEIAAAGTRPVALTPAERRLAAAAILARPGGSPWRISQRLRMGYAAAVALAADLATRQEGTAA